MTLESALDELIQKVSTAQSQIDELVCQVNLLEQQKQDAREEAECSLLQLRQLQEYVEQLHLASQGKEVVSLQEMVQELKEELSAKDLELKQVMEDLEHYFVQCRFQSTMLVEHEKLQDKLAALLANSFA